MRAMATIVVPALAALGLAAPAAAQVETSWRAPDAYIQGAPFVVRVEVATGAEGGTVPAWLLEPSAFEVDGRALGERGGGGVDLGASASLVLEFDLAPHLAVKGPFRLGFAQGDAAPIEVAAYRAAPEGLGFLDMDPEELARYRVLMATNQGSMLFEFWPDVAPNHVRNFLDLSYTGFYEGLLFHRVSPTFMIQGGCPNTRDRSNPRAWGSGSGPRTLEAEFNERKHVRGVLSMARTNDPNSATSQFFLMTAQAPFLDGKYSAFGRLVSGDDTLGSIASAPGQVNQDRTVRPAEPQEILHTWVVLPLGG